MCFCLFPLINILFCPVCPETQQEHVRKEEEILTEWQLYNQERNKSLDQDETESLQEEPEFSQNELEPPQINEEKGEPCIRQDDEQLLPKRETDTFMVTPDYEERNNWEPEPNPDPGSQNSPQVKNQDQDGSWSEDVGRNRDEELKQVDTNPQTRDHGDSFDSPEVKRHTISRPGMKPFSCQTCGKIYSCRKTLTIHLRSHTGERPFKCQICGKCFSDRKTLTSHTRTHTGEKPYPCEICGKHFSQRGNLITHIRTHVGEKPFFCGTCGKGFITKLVLIKHERTHTGEKPFSCQTCGKSFSQKYNLFRHMKTHRGAFL